MFTKGSFKITEIRFYKICFTDESLYTGRTGKLTFPLTVNRWSGRQNSSKQKTWKLLLPEGKNFMVANKEYINIILQLTFHSHHSQMFCEMRKLK